MCGEANPDGYTLLVNALADVQNLHYLSVPYDPVKDFALIGMITDGPPLILIVNANEPYKSVAELVAYAKANPSKVSFGTSGPATSPAIAVTQLNNQAKTNIVEVPYRGRRRPLRASLPARCRGASYSMPMLAALSGSGRVRALAVTSPKRLASWPEIPTMEELGYSGFYHAGFVGLAAPANTPAPIIAFLNKQLNDAIHSDSFKKRVEPLGMTVPEVNTPESFAAFMRTRDRAPSRTRQINGACDAGEVRDRDDPARGVAAWP